MYEECTASVPSVHRDMAIFRPCGPPMHIRPVLIKAGFQNTGSEYGAEYGTVFWCFLFRILEYGVRIRGGLLVVVLVVCIATNEWRLI